MLIELGSEVAGGAGIFQAVADCLGSVPLVVGRESRTKAIADILIGSKRTRIGAQPSPEHRKYLETQIERCLAYGYPIEIICLWGAVKGYGLDGERNQPDLADAMGIRRFAMLDELVSTLHAPGLRVRLIRENVGELALSTTDAATLAINMVAYREGLDNLARIISPFGHVRFEDESSLLTKLGISQTAFLMQGRSNGAIMEAYLRASDGKPDEQKDRVPEYAALLDLGWQGIVPDSIRDWYKARVTAEHAGKDPIKPIADYFGFALTRYKVGLYTGNWADDIFPLKASFVPYPPGTSDAMRRGRLEYKVKDSKGNNTVPPWCGYGFLREGEEFDPTILGVREYVERDSRRFEVVLKHSGLWQAVRADILAA